MIRVSGPWITQREIDYVADATARCWFHDAYVYHEKFEALFARYVGSRHAMALPSCTSALHLVLAALDLKPGDEVIVPETTWIASVAPVTYCQAVPVFADIDAQTWCISAESFEARITPKTRAVIPVDLYGGMPNMSRILEIARRHDIFVLEDAAQALGSAQAGVKAGAWGEAGVYSFHGSKTITTHEGGMFVTSDPRLFERVEFLRDHGRARTDRSLWNTEVGFKYKMSAMQAALGLAQMERVEEIVAKKREIFRWYEEEFRAYGRVGLNAEPEGMANSFWMVTIVGTPSLGLTKEDLAAKLREKNIETRPFHYPLSMMPAFRRYIGSGEGQRLNPVSYRVSANGINLPSGLQLTRDDVHYVSESVKDILDRHPIR